MGPTQEALALADFLIAKHGFKVDRYSLAYAIMEHEEAAIRAEDEHQPRDAGQRARELLADAYREGGYPRAAGTLEAGVIDSLDACALRAITRALSESPGGSPAVFDRATIVRDAELRAACYRLRELVEGRDRFATPHGFRLKDSDEWVQFHNIVSDMQNFRGAYAGTAATQAPGGELSFAVKSLVSAATEIDRQAWGHGTSTITESQIKRLGHAREAVIAAAGGGSHEG